MLSASSSRFRLRALATLAGALALVTTGSMTAWGQQAAPRSGTNGAGPITELDFLLGDFSCAYTDLTLAEPVTVNVDWKTEKTLGGAFYEMRLIGTTPAFEGRWVFGRNAVDDEFTSFYWDTWGNTGTATSQGWNDNGMLRFRGPYVIPAGHVASKDEFRIVDGDRFTDDAFIRFPGEEWKAISHVDCRRN
ncbi:hypothetical protein [Streptomyces fulvorobeus]|uniref:DUF1579 domain-containing protein n=1 Tax=Streptomyces fulvorobeus TaxID=284028 RepID=A0A7J0CES1_9ACTN|nr:hypothetical protein [Streptomyces fulvorobeus]NYE43817.1 hypothetical protein [Streptomyces fulvorobeus]GFN00305.1 hypothetical protein Sfulv_51150 [Streptomyces fulvorobeus]